MSSRHIVESDNCIAMASDLFAFYNKGNLPSNIEESQIAMKAVDMLFSKYGNRNSIASESKRWRAVPDSNVISGKATINKTDDIIGEYPVYNGAWIKAFTEIEAKLDHSKNNMYSRIKVAFTNDLRGKITVYATYLDVQNWAKLWRKHENNLNALKTIMRPNEWNGVWLFRTQPDATVVHYYTGFETRLALFGEKCPNKGDNPHCEKMLSMSHINFTQPAEGHVACKSCDDFLRKKDSESISDSGH